MSSIPSLPFRMHVPLVSDDSVAIRDHLIRAVREEAFTPFLGAGASSLRPTKLGGSHWQSVMRRLSCLDADLESEPERQYLRSVANGHGVELNAADLGERFEPEGPLDDALFSLQVALIQLGSYLIDAFGREMSRTRAWVLHIEDCAVRLSDRGEHDVLRDLFLNAADAAMRMRDVCSPPQEARLHARTIYERLLVCCCRICASNAYDCARTRERCQTHCERIDDLVLEVPDLKTRDELKLDELLWLADLFWHTVRFPLHAYPTTSELTFYLSLMIATSQQLRRGRLAQVAELQGRYGDQLDGICDWLEFCEQGDTPADLHLGTAAALQYQFGDKGSMVGESLPWPVAFTTNYDRALERAFDRLGVPYHVVFPVFAGSPGSEKHSQEPEIRQDQPEKETEHPPLTPTSIAWVFTTVFPAHARRSRSPDDCTKWKSDDLDKMGIAGPIVVKLHGSPLHRVPEPNDLHMPQRTVLQHCIVLAESSYLVTIMTDNPYPPWIEWALKDCTRSMWFLGYSIADWNIRLRLFEHVRPRMESYGEKRPRTMRVAFDRQFDYLQGAVLGALDVCIYKGELETLGAWLKNTPEVWSVWRDHLG